MASLLDIRDILDLKSFQKIQDDIAKATEFAIVTVDYMGIPVTEHSRCSEFCKLIRKKKEFSKLCEKCDSRGGLEAAREGSFYIYKCHRGLVDVAVPIIIEGQYLGSVMVGQVLVDNEENYNLEEVLTNTLEYDVKEKEEILEAYNKIPVLSFEKIKSVSEMMSHVSNYIVEEALLKRTQNEIYKKNIEIAKAERTKFELEEEYKACQLKALQSQINPHFLFNVLNSIASLAIIEDAPKTQEVIYNLSYILRYTLKKANKIVRLDEEINHVKAYLEIQKVRFGDRIKYNLDFNENDINVQIPFMALQVFVENAVLHGIEEKEQGGSINMSIEDKGEKILVTISDDGVGISKEKLDEIREDLKRKEKFSLEKVGINNVNKRMYHYYGNDYDIKIESCVSEGTNVYITIPKKI
ncbi:sensor histidine kinase [Clostridium sp. B9]|uniref:sensor histidine kinase n=1 Tax=Clostridium sp. B9 TaxID=3423224 RepID=UPI003D2F4B0E